MYFVENVDVKVDPTEILQNLITLYFDRDYDSICKILKIEDKKCSDNIPSDKYYKKGMIFCDNDNPPIQVRIHVDEETKQIFNTLSMVSSKSITEKELTDIIIDRWINDNIPKIVGKESYIRLKVGEKTWNTLIIACKNKDITSKIALKIAVLNFINYNIIPTKSIFDNNNSEPNNKKQTNKLEKIEVLKDDKYVINDKINVNALMSYIENKVNRSYNSNEICDLNECWECSNSAYRKYGTLCFSNNIGVSHRISYIIKNGYIPKGMIICHKCDNPSCINPNHLFAGTYSDNAKDSVNKGRHCYRKYYKNSIFTEEQIKKIHDMFNNGLTKTEIAKKIGCNKQQLNIAFYYKFKK